jgi:hypothetical protein
MLSKTDLSRQNPWVMMNMRSSTADGKVSPRCLHHYPWAKYWMGPLTIYFGHDAARGLQIYDSAMGLDTGCVYGEELTAVLLPSKRIVSVKAKRAYVDSRKSQSHRYFASSRQTSSGSEDRTESFNETEEADSAPTKERNIVSGGQRAIINNKQVSNILSSDNNSELNSEAKVEFSSPPSSVETKAVVSCDASESSQRSSFSPAAQQQKMSNIKSRVTIIGSDYVDISRTTAIKESSVDDSSTSNRNDESTVARRVEDIEGTGECYDLI